MKDILYGENIYKPKIETYLGKFDLYYCSPDSRKMRFGECQCLYGNCSTRVLRFQDFLSGDSLEVIVCNDLIRLALKSANFEFWVVTYGQVSDIYNQIISSYYQTKYGLTLLTGPCSYRYTRKNCIEEMTTNVCLCQQPFSNAACVTLDVIQCIVDRNIVTDTSIDFLIKEFIRINIELSKLKKNAKVSKILESDIKKLKNLYRGYDSHTTLSIEVTEILSNLILQIK